MAESHGSSLSKSQLEPDAVHEDAETGNDEENVAISILRGSDEQIVGCAEVRVGSSRKSVVLVAAEQIPREQQ